MNIEHTTAVIAVCVLFAIAAIYKMQGRYHQYRLQRQKQALKAKECEAIRRLNHKRALEKHYARQINRREQMQMIVNAIMPLITSSLFSEVKQPAETEAQPEVKAEPKPEPAASEETNNQQ